MADSTPEINASCSLDDLIQLNEEIVSLTRAEFPLELGLGSFGASCSGRLKKITESISNKLAHGNSLSEAIDSEQTHLPRMYGALVRSGLKSGKLSETLEAFNNVGSQLAQLRRDISTAMIYPTFLLFIACLSLGFITHYITPELLELIDSLRIELTTSQNIVKHIYQTAIFWCPASCIAILFAVVLWIRTDKSFSLRSDTLFEKVAFAFLSLFVPWLYFSRRLIQQTVFAKLLALFVCQHIPLPEAFRLAGEACGNPSLRRAANDIAMNLEQGGNLSDYIKSKPTQPLPKLMTRLFAMESDTNTLATTLNEMANSYHRQSNYMVQKNAKVYPLVLVVGILCVVVTFYSCVVYMPIIDMLNQIDVY